MCEFADLKKHAECLRSTGRHCVFLPSSLYARAAELGADMTGYVIQRPIPMPDKPGTLLERKRISNRDCGGITCLPGRSGKCVACADEE